MHFLIPLTAYFPITPTAYFPITLTAYLPITLTAYFPTTLTAYFPITLTASALPDSDTLQWHTVHTSVAISFSPVSNKGSSNLLNTLILRTLQEQV